MDNFDKLDRKLAQQEEHIATVRDHVSSLMTQQITEQADFRQEVSTALAAQSEILSQRHEDHVGRLFKLEDRARLHG